MSISDRVRKLRHAILSAPVIAKVMAVTVGLTVLLMASLLWQVYGTWHALALSDLEQRGEFLAQHEANEIAPWLLGGNMAALQRYESDVDLASPEASSVQVFDGKGHLLMNSRTGEPNAGIHVVTAPLPGVTGAVVRVAMLDTHVNQEVHWMMRRLVITTAVIAVIGFLIAWWLASQLARPMRELVAAVGALKAGNFEIKAPVHAYDEVGRLAVAFNDMTGTLARKEAALHRLLQKVVAAAEEERRRIARDLHDQTGQTLTALIAGLRDSEIRPQSHSPSDLRIMAEKAYEEVHNLSTVLRSGILDDEGLVPALREHCRSFASHSNVRVDYDAIGMDNNERLPAEVEVSLYRIVQEALTNAVRHGQCRAIQVLLQRRNGNVTAVIEDDGLGFDASRQDTQDKNEGHLGLVGIEERVAILNGRFRLESQPGAGATLVVEIPIEEKHHAKNSHTDRG
jgi:signal transduction histidine kinase